MQCENSPCTAVCPVGATYRTADGVVLVDEDRCIGCGYCVVACPYGARYIVPAGGDTPQRRRRASPTSARSATTGSRRGQLPACVEVCPVGARDVRRPATIPTSAVSVALREKPTQVLKPDLGTQAAGLYLGLEGEVG